MWKASVARSLAYSRCVTNGDCFCFHLPLCPSCDVTWACSSQSPGRVPLSVLQSSGRWRAAVCPHSVSRPDSRVGAAWWFQCLGSLPCLKGPHPFSLPALPSPTSRGRATPRGLSVLACPLRPPVFVCPLPPSRPAFPPHTWLPDHPRAACLSHAGRHPQSRCPRTQRLLGTHDSFCSVSITCIVYLLASRQRFMLFRVQCGFHELSASKAVLPLGLLYLQTPRSLCVE